MAPSTLLVTHSLQSSTESPYTGAILTSITVVKVELAVLGSLSLISLVVSVAVKRHEGRSISPKEPRLQKQQCLGVLIIIIIIMDTWSA